MALVIANGTVVIGSDERKLDVRVEEGKISAIGENLAETWDSIVDAQGMYVLPGMIDAHTHMELQQSEKYRSVDDFYTGTAAAAVGGTTTIIDHIGFGPAGCDLHYSIDQYHEKAKKSAIDYGFHGVFQHVDEAILEELEGIVTNEGIPSFKGYSTYGFKMSDSDFLRILETMDKTGGLLTVHAENDDITNFLREKYVGEGETAPIFHAKSRPNRTESETIGRLIEIGSMANDAPLYLVHTSTKESLDAVRVARERGYDRLYVETCPQYLLLTEKAYYANGVEEGLKYLCAPPLRTDHDTEALWKAVEDGTVQVIATDHCPFTLAQKRDGIDDFTKAPGGTPGVEERVRLIFSEGVMKGRISLSRFVEVMATNPAKIFGLYPQKGTLEPGSDADIVIIDPRKTQILSKENTISACDYCAYEGWEVQGTIHQVYSKGKLIAEDNVFFGAEGEGEFLHRSRSV